MFRASDRLTIHDGRCGLRDARPRAGPRRTRHGRGPIASHGADQQHRAIVDGVVAIERWRRAIDVVSLLRTSKFETSSLEWFLALL
jgi:hypothetical protein